MMFRIQKFVVLLVLTNFAQNAMIGTCENDFNIINNYLESKLPNNENVEENMKAIMEFLSDKKAELESIPLSKNWILKSKEERDNDKEKKAIKSLISSLEKLASLNGLSFSDDGSSCEDNYNIVRAIFKDKQYQRVAKGRVDTIVYDFRERKNLDCEKKLLPWFKETYAKVSSASDVDHLLKRVMESLLFPEPDKFHSDSPSPAQYYAYFIHNPYRVDRHWSSKHIDYLRMSAKELAGRYIRYEILDEVYIKGNCKPFLKSSLADVFKFADKVKLQPQRKSNPDLITTDSITFYKVWAQTKLCRFIV